MDKEIVSIALMMGIIGVSVMLAVVFGSSTLLYASVIAYIITLVYICFVLLSHLGCAIMRNL